MSSRFAIVDAARRLPASGMDGSYSTAVKLSKGPKARLHPVRAGPACGNEPANGLSGHRLRQLFPDRRGPHERSCCSTPGPARRATATPRPLASPPADPDGVPRHRRPARRARTVQEPTGAAEIVGGRLGGSSSPRRQRPRPVWRAQQAWAPFASCRRRLAIAASCRLIASAEFADPALATRRPTRGLDSRGPDGHLQRGRRRAGRSSTHTPTGGWARRRQVERISFGTAPLASGSASGPT